MSPSEAAVGDVAFALPYLRLRIVGNASATLRLARVKAKAPKTTELIHVSDPGGKWVRAGKA